jgi:very-short-patch-repair endonuclease
LLPGDAVRINLKAYARRHAADPRITDALTAQDAVQGTGRAGAGKKSGEVAEAALIRDLRLAGLAVEEQYPWGKEAGRRYRSDAAILAHRLLLESAGGVHRIRARYEGDLERSRIATDLGWTVRAYSPAEALDGSAAADVLRYLEGKWNAPISSAPR